MPIRIMPEGCRIAVCSTPTPTSSCNWNQGKKIWYTALIQKYGSGTITADEKIAQRHLPPGFTDIQAPYYTLRPEAIEGIFDIYRVTRDRTLMDRACFSHHVRL
jgi:mannosyl-oligosaccharide alpha-1,2-mannosidase